MLSVSTYDIKSELYLDFDLYSKGQPCVDVSIIGEGPAGYTLELTKEQVSKLIVGLVEIHKEMS